MAPTWTTYVCLITLVSMLACIHTSGRITVDGALYGERLEDAIKDFVDEWDRHNNGSWKLDDVVNTFKSEEHDNRTEDQEVQMTRNCSRCLMHDDMKALRIDAIKSEILSKLGLRHPPNISGKAVPKIPPLHQLLDQYDMQKDAPGEPFMPGPQFEEEVDDYHVTAEKLISFGQSPSIKWNFPADYRYQYFKFSANVINSHVTGAHLWLYIRPTPSSLDSIAWIVVYQVMRGETSPSLLHVKAKKVDTKLTHGGWATIDVRKIVSRWLRHPKDNLGFAIRSYDSEGRELAVTEPREGEEAWRPFIEMKIDKQRRRRTKRMIGLNCEENSNEVRCCRYPLTVDFEEFGWDWIIAPKRYEANYCSGECPYVFLQKYPHTHLVQQANPQGSAGPCCAPRKMSPISMLYFDEEYNIIYGMLPGMVVDRCGCS
ncbi:growth/differentiation factor 8 [Centruroides vittatus]|uniref:growth/differentiation factor 8 n=1 Tax=Centruroides vittatus TaxID=120091 RepID=UPI00350FEBFD